MRPCEHEKTWNDEGRRILLRHVERYPLMEQADLYKLAYQAVFGCEHAVWDLEAARRRLEEEWTTLGEGPDEPISDPIAPDGSVIRIHLRPFKAAGGTVTQVFEAFVRTARNFRGDASRMRAFKTLVMALAEEGRLPWAADDVAAFWMARENEGWPAFHHSRVFAERYRPAYRVIAARHGP